MPMHHLMFGCDSCHAYFRSALAMERHILAKHERKAGVQAKLDSCT